MLEEQWGELYKKLKLIEGGTKSTSFKILEKLPDVMENLCNPENFKTEQDFKTFEEFIFNVYRLAAHMGKQQDAQIEDYHCKEGCKHESEVVCAGEYFYIINSKSKRECPCYNLSQDEIEKLAKELDKYPLG